MGAITKLEAYGIGLIVIALAAAAFGFYEHHKGYLAGKKEVQIEFDKFKNEVTQAGLKAEQDRIKLQQDRDKITALQEKQHAEQDAAIRARYDAIIAGLRSAQAKGNSGGNAAKSLPQPSNFSDDAAANKRLSDALFGYRQGVLGLFAKAEQQTRQLTQCQDWIKAQTAVNK